MRHRLANLLKHFAVLFDGVSPFHPLEHRVRSALHGHVQVRRDLGKVADRLEQVGGHVPRIVGHEPQPADPFDPVQSLEKICEALGLAGRSARVTIDRLPDQRDFQTSLVGQLPHFRLDLVGWTVLFRSPHGRDNAVGTELIAAEHDPHHRVMPCRTGL